MPGPLPNAKKKSFAIYWNICCGNGGVRCTFLPYYTDSSVAIPQPLGEPHGSLNKLKTSEKTRVLCCGVCKGIGPFSEVLVSC